MNSKNTSKWLVKKSKFVSRKNPLEHKYSVIFVRKVGTKRFALRKETFFFMCVQEKREEN